MINNTRNINDAISTLKETIENGVSASSKSSTNKKLEPHKNPNSKIKDQLLSSNYYTSRIWVKNLCLDFMLGSNQLKFFSNINFIVVRLQRVFYLLPTHQPLYLNNGSLALNLL